MSLSMLQIGHLMGCAHDRAHSTGLHKALKEGFEYGNVNVGGLGLGTIQSYATKRIPYFASPEILYKGTIPTGNATTGN